MWWILITLKYSFNVSWKPGWNILIWKKCIFLFKVGIGLWMWVMHLAVFYHHRTSRKKRWILNVMFQLGNMRDYRNALYVGCWYSTMNATLMINFPPFICIEQGSVSWSSIMLILLTFIILRSLIICSLLLSKIIPGGTGCFSITQTVFCIIFTGEVWLTLYKHIHKNER